MSNEEIELDANFIRGMFSLERQFMNVNDMIIFWKLYGPSRRGPWPERMDPWFAGLTSYFDVC